MGSSAYHLRQSESNFVRGWRPLPRQILLSLAYVMTHNHAQPCKTGQFWKIWGALVTTPLYWSWSNLCNKQTYNVHYQATGYVTKPPGKQASINRCLSQARINWEGYAAGRASGVIWGGGAVSFRGSGVHRDCRCLCLHYLPLLHKNPEDFHNGVLSERTVKNVKWTKRMPWIVVNRENW